ncbi:Crp/Fnr family transcriptional regulator [Streptomyces sp. NPDC060048]|uniref:Crp/Fnr family transcriptional regulator n=1 Tax=unclassified Streptomyces TaxID=2593676 RepID=UPI0036A5C8B0
MKVMNPSFESGMTLLTEEELSTLAEQGHAIRYPPGSILFGEGEETDFALLLRVGHVKVQVGRPPRTVAVRGPGEIIGEMAAVRRKPRSASIVAVEKVEALYIPAMSWLRFLYENPRAMHAQLVAADERLDEATQKSVESYLGVEQRLAKSLVELIEKGLGSSTSRGMELRFSQRDLASLVGVSRESVVQVIRGFKDAGIVDTGRNVSIVTEMARLREIADGKSTSSSRRAP